jgi:hypothetical protein
VCDNYNCAIELARLAEKIDAADRFNAQARADMMRLLDERQASNQEAMSTAFEAAEKAVSAALEASKQATTKAETAAEKRFESVNEFRGQLSDQARTFLPRGEYDEAQKYLVQKVEETSKHIADLELRLSSRLDVTQGGNVANAVTGRTRRENLLLIATIISFLVAMASIITGVIIH